MKVPSKGISGQTEVKQFPGGWRIGDECLMFTNKTKCYTNTYIVVGYSGKYFELRDASGNLYRASELRLFRSREEAIASLKKKGRE